MPATLQRQQRKGEQMNLEPACRASMDFLRMAGFKFPCLEAAECIGEVIKVDFVDADLKTKAAGFLIVNLDGAKILGFKRSN